MVRFERRSGGDRDWDSGPAGGDAPRALVEVSAPLTGPVIGKWWIGAGQLREV